MKLSDTLRYAFDRGAALLNSTVRTVLYLSIVDRTTTMLLYIDDQDLIGCTSAIFKFRIKQKCEISSNFVPDVKQFRSWLAGIYELAETSGAHKVAF